MNGRMRTGGGQRNVRAGAGLWWPAMAAAACLGASTAFSWTDPNYEATVVVYEFTGGTNAQGLIEDSSYVGTNEAALESGAAEPTFQTDTTNDWYSFDGGDWADAPHTAWLALTNMTLSVWVNSSSTAYRAIMTHGNGSSPALSNYLLLLWNTDKIALLIGGTWHQSSVAVQDGVWQHVAVTFDDVSNDVTFYIDGVLAGTSSEADALYTAGTYPFRLGRQGVAGNYFVGSMDEIRVYSTPLSSNDVYGIYNNTKWKFGYGAAETDETGGLFEF